MTGPTYKLAHFEVFSAKEPCKEIQRQNREGFIARNRTDLAPFPLTLPIDWSSDPFKDRNWMFQLHAWRSLDPLLQVLNRKASAQKQVLPSIFALIADWVAHNVRGNGGTYTWYDMSTGIRASKLGLLLRLATRIGFAFPQKVAIDDLVRLHIEHLCNPEELNHGNHGLFQINGAMALATALPESPLSINAIRYARDAMKMLLADQLGSHGVHTEGAPGYHFFTLSKIITILECDWWKGDDFGDIHRLVDRADIARGWMVSPDSRCLPVGDSARNLYKQTLSRLYEWPHERNANTIGAKLDVYGVARTDTETSISQSGIVFMHAGFRNNAHKHADCLSLIWQEGGEDILIDSGKYGYQGDSMRRYFKSTRAHNTIEIDGRSYNLKADRAYGSGLEDITPFGRGWLMTAQRTHLDFGVTHARSVIWLPGAFVLAVDYLKPTDGRHRYVAGWHFNKDAILTLQSTDTLEMRLPSGRPLLARFAANTAGLLDTARGQMKPEPLGWVSEAYLQYQPATTAGFTVEAVGTVLISSLFVLDERVFRALPTVEDRRVVLHGVRDALLPPRSISMHGIYISFD
ncbi:MAG: alginate lyase family protein [Burkholderiaceae bacterium]|nr:alginate lyase family protein [Burkholderiaceae bacterium]